MIINQDCKKREVITLDSKGSLHIHRGQLSCNTKNSTK